MSINYTYEITLVEPMADYELELIAANCEDLVDEDTEIDIAMNSNGRILMLEGEIGIETVIKILAESGQADDVGLIRQIVEYIPDREMILVEFE